jgi:HAD superfamily hydrolase (TIGR01549 family)
MKMVENTGGQKTNEQVFYEDFISATGKDIGILNPLFDEFYTREFHELKPLTKSEPYIIKVVELLKKRGYELVVATNPVFPLTAIKARIGWAGLDCSMFKFITCFEKMHYCKPNLEYFGEILEAISRRSEECMMVGNDVEEDLVASKLGIKTFLIEDNIINRNNMEVIADNRGSYKEFYDFVNENFPCI